MFRLFLTCWSSTLFQFWKKSSRMQNQVSQSIYIYIITSKNIFENRGTAPTNWKFQSSFQYKYLIYIYLYTLYKCIYTFINCLAGRTNANESVKKISTQLMDVSAMIPPSFFQVFSSNLIYLQHCLLGWSDFNFLRV